MPKKSAINIGRYKNPELLAALGAHCKRLREKKGYSIDRLGRESQQLSPSVIHRLENGKSAPTVSALFRYAQVLNVPLRDLFDFELASKALAPKSQRSAGFKVWSLSDQKANERAYKDLLPLFSIQAAAGYFGHRSSREQLGWVDAARFAPLSQDMFVIQAVGDSMEPAIFNQDYLVMKAQPKGTRQGKIVLAEYVGPVDPETGGSFTIKKYSSVKMFLPDQHGDWRHRQITLSPLNPSFEPIVLEPKDEGDFQIVAELVGVLS